MDLQEQNEFKRKIIGDDRYYLWRPNPNNLAVTRIKGSFSVYQLKSALEKVRRKHPMLGTRVYLDEGNNAWITSRGVPNFTVIVDQRKTDDEWMKRMLAEFKFPLLLDKGPLARFVLLQSDESLDLIVNCHHMVCDGMALTYLIKDILFYLGNPNQEAEPQPYPPVIGRDNLPYSASISIFNKIMIGFFNKLWKRKKIFFNESDYKKLHQTFWSEERKSRILTWELTESQTNTLIDRCHKEKVSVNSAIVTAFFTAQIDVQGTSPAFLHRISIPVDIRNRVIKPLGEVIGNFISAFQIDLNYTQEKSFWDLARTFQRTIKEQLTNENVFRLQLQLMALNSHIIDSIYFVKHGMLTDRLAAFFLRMTGEDKIKSGFNISNLGRIDFPEKDGSLHLEWMYGPCVFEDIYEKFLGVMTVGSKMYFIISFDESVINSSIVEKNRDKAMEYLHKAVNW